MQTSISQVTFFIIITTILVFLLAILIISVLVLYQRRQLVHNHKIDALRFEFEKNLLKTQVEIQEQTFHHISREIHDNISLSLTLAKLNLATLQWNDVSNTRQSVTSSIHILAKTIDDLSHLSRSMNTDVIRNMGLMNAIENEMVKLKDLAHLEVSYSIEGEPIFMDSERELVVFRIIQEAFNNILRHAQATKVWLQLDYQDSSLDVLIKDNGVGFQNNEEVNKVSVTAGLNNMKSRASLFGGKVQITSQQEEGTKILVTVPYE